MELTNTQILDINQALQELIDQPIEGIEKFNLMQTVQDTRQYIMPILKSVTLGKDGKSVSVEGKNKEILDAKQDVYIKPISRKLLEKLEITTRALIALAPIMTQEGEEA